jgi:glycerate-2-kinase
LVLKGSLSWNAVTIASGAVLRRIFAAAIENASPSVVVLRNLPAEPTVRCIIVGAGKASAAMADAIDKAWPDVDVSGVVVTRYGHGVATRQIRSLRLDSQEGGCAIASDTNIIDGSEDPAGAFVAPDKLARQRHADLDARASMAAHAFHWSQSRTTPQQSDDMPNERKAAKMPPSPC